MLLLSMLGILSTYKDRLGILIDSNNGARCIVNKNCGNVNNNGKIDITSICGDLDGDYLVSADDVSALLILYMYVNN